MQSGSLTGWQERGRCAVCTGPSPPIPFNDRLRDQGAPNVSPGEDAASPARSNKFAVMRWTVLLARLWLPSPLRAPTTIGWCQRRRPTRQKGPCRCSRCGRWACRRTRPQESGPGPRGWQASALVIDDPPGGRVRTRSPGWNLRIREAATTQKRSNRLLTRCGPSWNKRRVMFRTESAACRR